MSKADAVFPNRPPLPMGSLGRRSSGYSGMVFLVLSEASLFAYLFFSYFYFSVQPHPGPWPPGGPPGFTYSAPQTVVALVGCATAWWADRSAAAGALFWLASPQRCCCPWLLSCCNFSTGTTSRLPSRPTRTARSTSH